MDFKNFLTEDTSVTGTITNLWKRWKPKVAKWGGGVGEVGTFVIDFWESQGQKIIKQAYDAGYRAGQGEKK